MDINADLLQWFVKTSAIHANKFAGSGIINENILSKELAEELHKPIIRKVHSSFVDNIWGDDLGDMQLISTFNEEFRFLLCVIDIFCKYA